MVISLIFFKSEQLKIFFHLNGQEFVDEVHVAWNIVSLKNCYKSFEHICESFVFAM